MSPYPKENHWLCNTTGFPDPHFQQLDWMCPFFKDTRWLCTTAAPPNVRLWRLLYTLFRAMQPLILHHLIASRCPRPGAAEPSSSFQGLCTIAAPRDASLQLLLRKCLSSNNSHRLFTSAAPPFGNRFGNTERPPDYHAQPLACRPLLPSDIRYHWYMPGIRPIAKPHLCLCSWVADPRRFSSAWIRQVSFTSGEGHEVTKRLCVIS